ncbi:MAG: uroporphyrinogen decarboxylase [Thaumarchaeota archaeon]|nr:uroporphyrinogen decarboxylase [Nitrososphaerota archaeon]
MVSVFTDACRRKETEYTPVWFMRQAGRYLPSYRRLKGTRNVLDIAKDPELASEAVVSAVHELGVDAGIIFADIMLPLEGMGVKFRIEENIGPVVSSPIRSLEDVSELRAFDSERDAGDVYDGIEETVRKLDGTPLIGFSGAPFTLAGYLIEGSPDRELHRTKAMMYGDPDVWEALMRKLTSMTKSYLHGQIEHGVDVVQIFDSWVGSLSAADYSRYVLPYTREIIESVGRNVPTIHFCANSGSLIEKFRSTKADVLSVDWRMDIGDVWRRCKEKVAVQGNLDPVVAAVGGKAMKRETDEILRRARNHRGHIFSLGHGILKETAPENLREIVKIVHKTTRLRP